MTNVTDVPADRFVKLLASRLREQEAIKPPDWAPFVKTGVHREKAPTDPDWWYTRTASIMRKVYLHSPIGVSQMGGFYGGSRDRGSKPNLAKKGSRSIIRKAFMQLEKAGLLKVEGKKGRILTPKGQKLMDGIAHAVLLELVKENPEMGKY
jgi:small subunit ribosomal protein S19e